MALDAIIFVKKVMHRPVDRIVTPFEEIWIATVSRVISTPSPSSVCSNARFLSRVIARTFREAEQRATERIEGRLRALIARAGRRVIREPYIKIFIARERY